MKTPRWASIVLLALAVLLSASPVTGQGQRVALVMRAQGPLTPAMAEYLDRGLARAAEMDAELVIFQLDTPGGQVDLMNRMVQSMRGSRVPVVVFVAPNGAMAGSAGTVLVLAGHVAAMAPETAIGAASPVGGQGEDLGETIATKVKEILKATVRSLAERRGAEAVAMAEAAIEEARAASAQEALDAGLIDFIANDLDELLLQLDGFSVQVGGQTRVLHTADLQVVELEQSLIEQLLQMLTNPNIVFILLTIGVQALLIELSSPGGWVAGFIGVVSLALGIYGLGILPVNWFGIVFLLTAFVLFVMEVKAPTHGALAAAGLASFIVGALVLFNSPGTPSFQRVSVPLVVGVGLVTAAAFIVLVSFALRAQRRKVAVGTEALVGRVGVAKSALEPEGTVQVAGELWSAVLEGRRGRVEPGARVEVVAVKGLRVTVRPCQMEES